jgi:hypothetical protein
MMTSVLKRVVGDTMQHFDKGEAVYNIKGK